MDTRIPQRPDSDQALVSRLSSGDEAAFIALVERHQRALIGFASTFTKNRALAQEIVQDTWMAVLKGLPGFEGRSSLKTWIFRILANRARSVASREARMVPMSAMGEPEGPILDPSRFDASGTWADPPAPWAARTPEDLIGRAEVLALVEAAMAELPARQRAVMLLRDFEHLDSAEVCELMELSEGNQRVLLHRARTAVRAALEPHLGRS